MISSKMTSTFSLLAVLFAAMFLRTDGQGSGHLSKEEVQERCQNDPKAVFAHPGQCQLFYNCSNNGSLPYPYSDPYLDECPYPQLFSNVTSRCQPFDDVKCGARVEPLNCDEYIRGRCYRGHCIPCTVNQPSCKGLPDGMNVYQHREWSPYYAVCRSQRVVDTGVCPRRNDLYMAQLFHPSKRRCVSLYEIPKEHSGYAFNCTEKADDLHLDDVTNRPDVYYRCHQGEMVCVQRCETGTYFDESRLLCAKDPVKNSIIDPYRQTSP